MPQASSNRLVQAKAKAKTTLLGQPPAKKHKQREPQASTQTPDPWFMYSGDRGLLPGEFPIVVLPKRSQRPSSSSGSSDDSVEEIDRSHRPTNALGVTYRDLEQILAADYPSLIVLPTTPAANGEMLAQAYDDHDQWLIDTAAHTIETFLSVGNGLDDLLNGMFAEGSTLTASLTATQRAAELVACLERVEARVQNGGAARAMSHSCIHDALSPQELRTYEVGITGYFAVPVDYDSPLATAMATANAASAPPPAEYARRLIACFRFLRVYHPSTGHNPDRNALRRG